jgi:hypothetical protein
MTYRAFVSYSHRDRRCAQAVVHQLGKLGLYAVFDDNVDPSKQFTGAIQDLIATSHVFVPVITNNANASDWVLHEVGFALGQNVPVLPIAARALPTGMIAGVQCLKVQSFERQHLSRILTRERVERILRDSCNRSLAVYQCVNEPQQRTPRLLEYLARAAPGRIRHLAAFSSFSLPKVAGNDPVWSRIARDVARFPEGANAFRQERAELEQIARAHTCDLIVCPTASVLATIGKSGSLARLEILTEFLESMPDESIRVVVDVTQNPGNLLIVGDSFLVEAVAGDRMGTYRQSVFTRHAPTVLQRCADFDAEFKLMLSRFMQGRPARQSSRAKALFLLRNVLKQLRRS